MSTDDAHAAGLPGAAAETHSRHAALERLGDGLGARHPFLLVTGEPGVGKTSLIGELTSRWGERAIVAIVESGAGSPTELIERILRGFGIEPPVNVARPQLLDRLERHIAEAEGSGQVPVIVIDDAHALSDDVLAELWAPAKLALMTQRPLEIVLLGHPALETRLAEPAFESIAQHVAVRCHVAAGADAPQKPAPPQPAATPPPAVVKPDAPAPVATPPAPKAAAALQSHQPNPRSRPWLRRLRNQSLPRRPHPKAGRGSRAREASRGSCDREADCGSAPTRLPHRRHRR